MKIYEVIHTDLWSYHWNKGQITKQELKEIQKEIKFYKKFIKKGSKRCVITRTSSTGKETK